MSESTVADRAAELAGAVTARGNNLVFSAPPTPNAARPVLAGLLSPADGVRPGLKLALAPEAAVEEWARVAAQVAAGTGSRVAGAHTPARLTRLLSSGRLDLVFTSPETAHELVRRASLGLQNLAGLLLVWPEAWAGEEAATLLLQDVSKEAQRTVITTDPEGAASLIERYCWRAHRTDLLGSEPLDPPPAVRSMPVAWSGRREALLDLAEQLDPETLFVWAPDPADHEGIAQTLAGGGVEAVIGGEVPAAASLVVAYELPSPSQLRLLAGAGPVVLLAPPGTEAYVGRLAPNRRALHQLGSLQTAQSALARSQRTIVETVARGAAPGAWAAIAPLLGRLEATAVAAALYELWEAAAAARGEPAATARPGPASVQLWVGIGKRDAVTPHDLVAALLKECGVPKEAIGKVEIRESFSLVQLGATVEGEQVAEKLTGRTIRKRRLVARVDRGRPPKIKR